MPVSVDIKDLETMELDKLRKLLRFTVAAISKTWPDPYIIEDEVSEGLLIGTQKSYYVDIHSPTPVP